MRIALVSKNRYLWQKLKLVRHTDEVTLENGGELPEYDRLIWDADSITENAPEGAVIISHSGDLTPAFTEEELAAAIGGTPRISLSRAARTATLDGTKIKLTELEFSLLSELISANGNFVSRETLKSRVFGGEGSDGLINVYVHYLREKLEVGNEKFIFSSRRDGYKIVIGKGGENNARN